MLGVRDEPVSPELALVDPVLRRRLLRESLQELLHERTEVLRPLLRETPGILALTYSAPSPHPRPAPRRPGRILLSVISVGALATLFLALPSLAFLPPREAPQLGQETVSSREETTIAWQSSPSDDYYMFELSAEGRLVRLGPLRAPSVTLGLAIPPGRYNWRVFVGRGTTTANDTRGPIAGGTVTLGYHDK